MEIPWGVGGWHRELQGGQQGHRILRLQACCSGKCRGHRGADVNETPLGQQLSGSGEHRKFISRPGL